MKNRFLLSAALLCAAAVLAGCCRYEGGDRNLALNRAAIASSSFDYNLTAQLATDGVIDNAAPAFLGLSTSKGPVARNEKEWIFDLKTVTSLKLDGPKEYVQLDFNNYQPKFDNVRIVASVVPSPGQNARWTVSFLGSSDGISWKELDRKSGRGPVINEAMVKGKEDYPHLKVAFESDNVEQWSFINWDFFNDGTPFLPANSPSEVFHRGGMISTLPSNYFSSAWMSAGAGEEWIYVDLGSRCKINEVKTHWIGNVPQGWIQVSDDAVNWKDVAPIAQQGNVSAKAQYVRLLCEAGGPYVLSELEVIGRGPAVKAAEARPEPADGRLDITAGGWKLQRASLVKADGPAIAAGGFDDSSWLPATVPGTVLVSYLDAGAIPDPNYSDYQLQISESFFNSDFWYRTDFTVPEGFAKERLLLNFDGINWKADIFVNGKMAGHLDGAFVRGKFDVTDLVKTGDNFLAVKIIHNAHPGAIKEQTALSADCNGGILGADNPTFHASIGWDWIPTIRGRNIGIWNDVYLTSVGAVTLEDPFVRSELENLNLADVLIETTVRNRTGKKSNGKIEGKFGDIPFSADVSLAPGEEKLVKIPTIKIENPKLWWPAGYGDPYLYDVSISYSENGKVSDSRSFKSGIRQMDYDEYDGSLRLYINGRRFVGRGGNWGFSESNLRYKAREYDAAVRYHADMHFTMIRDWVGQIGDEEFYEACDRHGVMVWQDFWLANPWDGPDPYDDAMFLANAEDYVKRIRNHASIGLYCGRNEGMPPVSLNGALENLTKTLHPGLHYIPHSSTGVVSGEGPYRALPVKEYFTLEKGKNHFHSERGMPAVMNYESLARTIPEDRIWPQSRLWGVHDYTLESAQHAASFNDMIAKGFGEPKDAREFTELAQWINYDGYRAMFESRSEYRRGLLLWMSHPAWPSMVWQTYDYYFEPTGAYFGCKKACEPLHIQFNPATGNVEVVNISAGLHKGMTAEAEVLSMNGKSLWKNSSSVDVKEDATAACFAVEVPETVSDVYFIKLKLSEAGVVVSDNFYWQGKEEGNWKALRNLPQTGVVLKYTTDKTDGVWKLRAEITNDSEVPALMLRIKALDRKGNLIAPVLYSDNYFFLMPGETRNVDVEFSDDDSHGIPHLELSGFNL